MSFFGRRRPPPRVAYANCPRCGFRRAVDGPHDCPPLLHVDQTSRLKGELSVRCVGGPFEAPSVVTRQGGVVWICSRCRTTHEGLIGKPGCCDPPPIVPLMGHYVGSDEGNTFGT